MIAMIQSDLKREREREGGTERDRERQREVEREREREREREERERAREREGGAPLETRGVKIARSHTISIGGSIVWSMRFGPRRRVID